jgi:copper chaperone NosL
MMRATFLMLCMCLALTACGEDGSPVAALPREPNSHAAGYYCRMTLSEHPGPKGQLLLKGATDPLWFTSVRDALIYVAQDLSSENEIAGFWVNDMAQGAWERPAPGSWIEANKAWYVVGSSRTAAMGGGESVPFKLHANAAAFAETYGGHVGDYALARREITEELAGEASGDPHE